MEEGSDSILPLKEIDLQDKMVVSEVREEDLEEAKEEDLVEVIEEGSMEAKEEGSVEVKEEAHQEETLLLS